MEFTIDMKGTYEKYGEMRDSELQEIITESRSRRDAVMENWKRNEQQRENLHPIKRFYHGLADLIRVDSKPYPHGHHLFSDF